MQKFLFMKKELARLEKKQLYNKIKTISSGQGAWLGINGKEYLNLCSNNYLGLANNPVSKAKAIKMIKEYGIGSGAVGSISGTTNLHIELEKLLAQFKSTDASMSIQSGFLANQAVIPALNADVIFTDELNHASIIDAVRLSKSVKSIYKHNDIGDLREKLESFKEQERKLIVTDSVFSMDGDIANLSEISKIAKDHNAILMIDDAHGEGVLGENGEGAANHFNLGQNEVHIDVGTLSKALGTVGGYISGKKILIEFLKQKARPFLFSSSLTIPDVASAITSIKLLQKDRSLVKKLWQNATYFQDCLKDLGFDLGKTETPITPIFTKEEKLTKKFSESLFRNNIFAMPITYPTVPKGLARIRFMPSAIHSKEDLDFAIEKIEETGKMLQIIN